jgi:hypothetical protein
VTIGTPSVRRLGTLASAALGALLAAACGETSVTQMTGPEPVRCELTLSAPSASVPAAGSQLNVGISTARDCTWSATSHATWIQAAPTAGQGDATLTLTVAANTAQSTRAGSVSVADQQYLVSQDAAAPPPPPPPPPPNCTYALTPVSRTLNANGGVRDVRVITSTGCPWVATPSVPWITIVGSASGTGGATIQYRVDSNRSGDVRIGAIAIAGTVHVVLQRD